MKLEKVSLREDSMHEMSYVKCVHQEGRAKPGDVMVCFIDLGKLLTFLSKGSTLLNEQKMRDAQLLVSSLKYLLDCI